MTKVSDETTERSVMTASTEAAELLRQIAGNGEPGETKKAAWLRAYRRLKGDWTFNRVKDLWRCEPRAKVSADELSELRRIAQQRNEAGASHDDVDRVQILRNRLRQIDPDYFGPDIDTLGRIVGKLGGARAS